MVSNGWNWIPNRFVELVGRDDPVDRLDTRGGATVSVVEGEGEQIAGLVGEAVVHAPGIDADAEQPGIRPARRPQTGHDLVGQARRVPVQPVGQVQRLVGEPMDLAKLQHLGARHGRR